MAFRSAAFEARSTDRVVCALAAAYSVLLVYGSLIPFEFRPLDSAAALRAFRDMPMIVIGLGGRADWLANGVVFVPLAVAWSAWASQRRGYRLDAVSAAAVIGGCAALAVTIEFLQIYFPPRTVSRNDLVAEISGAALGVAVWLAAGPKVVRLIADAGSRGYAALRAGLVAYAVAYTLLALFPYDFVAPGAELAAKIAAGEVHALVGPGCGGLVRCGAKLGLEAASLVPFGILLALMLGRTRSQPAAVGFLAGAFIGLAIEGVQIFLYSGVVQGASVLTRAVGVAVGAAAAGPLLGRPIDRLKALARAALLFLVPIYMIGLLALAWVARPLDGGWASALGRLAEVRWLPFYYHYFTTEQQAAVSTLMTMAFYAPLGLALGLWWWTCERRPTARRRALYAGAGASGLALIVEASRLFRSGAGHPDPSNLIIAALAAILGAAAIVWAERVLDGLRPLGGAPGGIEPMHRPTPPRARSPVLSAHFLAPIAVVQRVFAVALLGAVGAVLFEYPVAPVAIAGALALCFALFVRWPLAWLVALPACLPVFDLSPWTGWLLLDEFDLVVLIALAACLWTTPLRREDFALPTAAAWTVALLALSFAASALRGLLPIEPFDWNAIGGYDSGYNALRVAKAFVWALVLLPFLISAHRRHARARAALCQGVTVGLAGVALAVLYERQLFSGLFNFSLDYRVTGTFFSMHTGDQHIDAYLAAALPLVGVLLVMRPRPLCAAAAAALCGAAGYAVLVTYSRATYVACTMAVGVAWVGYLVARRSASPRRVGPRWRAAAATAVAGAGALIAVLAADVPYARARFETLTPDLQVRLAHWRDALAARDPGVLTSLIGMGLGTFPRTFWGRNPVGAVPGRFRFLAEDGDTFLSLHHGDSLYFGQRVRLAPNATYRFSFDARTQGSDTRIVVPVCEKSVLYSFDCRWPTLDLNGPRGRWTHYETAIRTDGQGRERGRAGWLSRRPVELALYYQSGPGALDIDNVRLFDPSGRDLIANGDFSRGGERWFFSVDNHLLWHEKNLLVHLLFEQGWLGLIAFVALSAVAAATLGRETWRGDQLAPLLLAALVGFYGIGLFGTLLDAPRLALLCFLLLFAAIALPRSAPSPADAASARP
jgi:VanZ family protein